MCFLWVIFIPNLHPFPNVVVHDALYKINIECEIHGVFSQMPSTHLNGGGCFNSAREGGVFNKNDYIKKANGRILKGRTYDEMPEIELQHSV